MVGFAVTGCGTIAITYIQDSYMKVYIPFRPLSMGANTGDPDSRGQFHGSYICAEYPRYSTCIRHTSMEIWNGHIQHVRPFGMLICSHHCDLYPHAHLGKELAAFVFVPV